MRIVVSQRHALTEPDSLAALLSVLDEEADFLRASYPQFDHWVCEKVIPGILAGERTVVIEKRREAVAGLLIVKHSADEKKLCTLRVRQQHEARGLGIRLFELAFDILNTEKPLLSVSEETKPKFARVFEHFGFSLEGTYPGLYRPRSDEFSYNGLLKVRDAIRSPSVHGHSLAEPSPFWASRTVSMSVAA